MKPRDTDGTVQPAGNWQFDELGVLLRGVEAAFRPLLVTTHLWQAESSSPQHRHRRGQLAYSGEGVISVVTSGGRWVTPANRAVWIPPGVPHQTLAEPDTRMHSVYIREDLSQFLPKAVTAVAISPLLRELIFRASALPAVGELSAPDARLHEVLLDQLRLIKSSALDLPMPRDKRLERICSGILEDPVGRIGLKEWAARVGASGRTISRLFPAETQLTFDEWRKQAMLLAALQRLARGEAVSKVALELNYESTSAFIVMFRKALGTTPGKYFAEPQP